MIPAKRNHDQPRLNAPRARMQISRNYPRCDRDDCGKLLTGNQKRFCSRQCKNVVTWRAGKSIPYYLKVIRATALAPDEIIPNGDTSLFCPVCADAGRGGTQPHWQATSNIYTCRKCGRERSK